MNRANRTTPSCGRRHELEANTLFGQALPYIVVRYGKDVLAYRRSKMVGEERLIGMTSIGIGGHVDLSDVAQVDSIISVVATFARAISRELDEELIIRDPQGQVLTAATLGIVPEIIGMINDTSDDVGCVHYGILMVLDIPNEYTVEIREPELIPLGLVDPATIDGCENWTRLAIEFMKADV